MHFPRTQVLLPDDAGENSNILSSRPRIGKTAPKFESPLMLPCGAVRGPALAPAPNGNRPVRGPPKREAFACRSQGSPPLFLLARAAGMQRVPEAGPVKWLLQEFHCEGMCLHESDGLFDASSRQEAVVLA